MRQLATLLLGLALPLGHPAEAGDFSFIQASDIHAPMPQSRVTLSRIRELGAVELAPFGVTVPKPSFVVLTGDLTEFGAGAGAWEACQSYAHEGGLPVYLALGNHDNTWQACIQRLRQVGLGPCYSFDHQGCHFVALMTATPQDPRPSVGEEQVRWLKTDLAKVGIKTPVLVFFHHPLGGREFASRYDWDRLLDVLREYNTVLLMAGHSHGRQHQPIQGVDQITGGTTFGTNAGFAVISVQGGWLRAAYWKAGQPAPEQKLIEKALPAQSPFPRVEITSPTFREEVGSNSLTISARLAGPVEVRAAAWFMDDEVSGELSLEGKAPEWTASGQVALSHKMAGAHSLRVEFVAGAHRYTRSTQFFIEPPERPTAWRACLGASSKVTPTVSEGVVYVAANDGRLRTFDAQTGAESWSIDTGAEILGQPLVEGDRVFVANGLGTVSAYARTGAAQWSFKAGEAVYSSPILLEDKLIFGCNDGKLYALEAATGKLAWINTDATYAIESKPCAWKGRVYYGAWDQYVRCVDARDGRLLWKQLSEGVRLATAAKRYYSPADAMPTMAAGRLLVADRNYLLSVFDPETGAVLGSQKKIAAIGASEDGKYGYVRQTDGLLIKIDPAGQPVWQVDARLGSVPAAPTEKNGMVYVSSDKGLISAVSAQDGRVVWQYQASPQLYVMSSVASDGTNAYVTSFDGTLTAIRATVSPDSPSRVRPSGLDQAR